MAKDVAEWPRLCDRTGPELVNVPKTRHGEQPAHRPTAQIDHPLRDTVLEECSGARTRVAPRHSFALDEILHGRYPPGRRQGPVLLHLGLFDDIVLGTSFDNRTTGQVETFVPTVESSALRSIEDYQQGGRSDEVRAPVVVQNMPSLVPQALREERVKNSGELWTKVGATEREESSSEDGNASKYSYTAQDDD
ncbi:hypothetical protein C8J57DRAFT_1256244 [Mycena rebaudengoi]|nr:hypothetical protein C8J57DRAFT_1256244 [Mycena rebaudengoi]